jgi:hypothetical protein
VAGQKVSSGVPVKAGSYSACIISSQLLPTHCRTL